MDGGKIGKTALVKLPKHFSAGESRVPLHQGPRKDYYWITPVGYVRENPVSRLFAKHPRELI